MPKFRKKPIVVEAIQWNGKAESTIDVVAFIGTGNLGISTQNGVKEMIVEVDGGVMKVIEKDWIVKDLNGRIYSCRPDIFAKTYDWVE